MAVSMSEALTYGFNFVSRQLRCPGVLLILPPVLTKQSLKIDRLNQSFSDLLDMFRESRCLASSLQKDIHMQTTTMMNHHILEKRYCANGAET